MPAFSLPFEPGKAPEICTTDSAEQLCAYLLPVNHPQMVARMGEETIVEHQGQRMVVEGQRFNTRSGWVQGRRYLEIDASGNTVGVVNVTLMKESSQRRPRALVSNVFVDASHRRRGVASGLLALAQKEFPALCADTSLTQAGAALLGQSAPQLNQDAVLDTLHDLTSPPRLLRP